MVFSIRWRGQKEQEFYCPNCSAIFSSRHYDLREPLGAVGMWQLCHMYVKNCPNCGHLAQLVDITETKDGFG